MEVKLLWATPDCEYQIVRVIHELNGTHDEIDSVWAPVGMKKLKGKMSLEYPVMKVILGEKDKKLLEGFVKDNITKPLMAATSAFLIKGISEEAIGELQIIYPLMPKLSGKETLLLSYNFEDWLELLTDNLYLPGQLELFEEEYKKVLKAIGKELYKLAPIVFEEYK